MTIARDFQIISKLEDTRLYVGGFLHFPKGKCLKSTPSSFVNEKSTFHRDNAGSEEAILHVNNVQKPVRPSLYEFPSYLRLLWDTWSLCTYIDIFGIFWLLFTLD